LRAKFYFAWRGCQRAGAARLPADTPAWEIEFPSQGRSQMEFGNESGGRCRSLAAEPCPRAAGGRKNPAAHGSRGVLRPISDPSRRPGQVGKPAAGAAGEWVKALSQKLESARGAGAGPEVLLPAAKARLPIIRACSTRVARRLRGKAVE